MFKKSVVALALFAGLLTSSTSFAQDFVITSAKASLEAPGASLASRASDRVEITVQKQSAQLAGQCWVMVKYFGTDALAMLRNGPGIMTKVAGTVCQAGPGEYRIVLDLPWRDFANRAGLKGQFVYFNAKVVLPLQASRPATFSAIVP
jgi:hypothetical protein